MPNSLQLVKDAALETYVTLCSSDARRIRAFDERDILRHRPETDKVHMLAALDWVCRAHDIGMDDGVPAMFSMIEGWVGSYPEVTGYLIPTMFDAASRFDSVEYRERATEMAEWLVSCQAQDGSFPGSFKGQLTEPRVFNTGQIIFGLVRAHKELDDRRFLHAAVRAGQWLVQQQDSDGCWRRNTFESIEHVYNARTAWAMAELADACGDICFRNASIANADWCVRKQDDSGWFRHNTFRAGEESVTLHTIAYAARGLLEVGAATGIEEYLESADRAAAALHRGWHMYHSIGGAYARDWTIKADWRCLPGEAQLCLVWTRLDQIRKNTTYRDAATQLLESVKAAQLFDDTNPDLHGGVTGPLPLNGGYERYCVVSWGAKFLIDALLLKTAEHGERPTG